MRRKAIHWSERLGLIALCGLLVTFPWQYRQARLPFSGPVFTEIHVFLSYFFWLPAVGFWLLGRLLNLSRERVRFGPPVLAGLMVALLALTMISCVAAVDPNRAARRILYLLLLFGLYLTLVNARLTRRAAAWALGAGMTLQAAVAIPQFLVGRSLGLHWLGEKALDPTQSGTNVVMAGYERWLRPYGLTPNPNFLGGFLMVCLLVISGTYLSHTTRQRFLLLPVFAIGLAALFTTFSRGAWLGMSLGALAMSLLLIAYRQRTRHPLRPRVATPLLFTALAITLVFALACWPLLQVRLGLVSQGTEIRSINQRVELSKAAWLLIREHPVLGTGLGNSIVALNEMFPEGLHGYVANTPIHNVFLLSMAELGVFGGVIWLALMAAPWLVFWLRRHQITMNPWFAGWSGALAGLALVSWLDHYVWFNNQGQLLQWIAWGLWAAEFMHAGPSAAQSQRNSN